MFLHKIIKRHNLQTNRDTFQNLLNIQYYNDDFSNTSLIWLLAPAVAFINFLRSVSGAVSTFCVWEIVVHEASECCILCLKWKGIILPISYISEMWCVWNLKPFQDYFNSFTTARHPTCTHNISLNHKHYLIHYLAHEHYLIQANKQCILSKTAQVNFVWCEHMKFVKSTDLPFYPSLTYLQKKN